MRLLFLNCLFLVTTCQPVEEFLVRGPDSLHSIAINTFLEERRKNPEYKELGENSPIMIRAKQHAVKRFAVQDENDLTLMVNLSVFLVFVSLSFVACFSFTSCSISFSPLSERMNDRNQLVQIQMHLNHKHLHFLHLKINKTI